MNAYERGIEQKREQKRNQVRLDCVARGLSVTPHGKAYLIEGNGVSFVTVDLAAIHEKDLEPYYTQH